jgi:2-polyprenyl-3-methyl-5-hydroxy-6-metoxy-1,4-benzoquinol methylase
MKYMLTPQHDIYRSLREKLMGASVLEVGFGTGAGVLQYAMAAEHVDAIEIDPGAVHFAKEMFPMSNVNWIEADITSWYSATPYDYVVMIETLEHIHDWRTALSAIVAMLKDEGSLIMSARNAKADLRRWKDLHEREWTGTELLDNLMQFFGPKVYLYDYSLQDNLERHTRTTPLIAIAKK